MTFARDSIETAILVSIGLAHLTRERAEEAVAELIARGRLGGDEGRQVVERLMGQVGGASGAALLARVEGGVTGLLREVGGATRDELEDVNLRLAELEHRLRLLEDRSRGSRD